MIVFSLKSFGKFRCRGKYDPRESDVITSLIENDSLIGCEIYNMTEF